MVERVTVFVMDANDEKPEFQNMPAIVNVLEVSDPTPNICMFAWFVNSSLFIDLETSYLFSWFAVFRPFDY